MIDDRIGPDTEDENRVCKTLRRGSGPPTPPPPPSWWSRVRFSVSSSESAAASFMRLTTRWNPSDPLPSGHIGFLTQPKSPARSTCRKSDISQGFPWKSLKYHQIYLGELRAPRIPKYQKSENLQKSFWFLKARKLLQLYFISFLKNLLKF